MKNKLFVLGALSLATVLPGIALADGVWVSGHYESRESRRVIPAETRQECLPDRYEDVRIPAVTERVRVPAMTERVRCAPMTEREWVPEQRERYWQHGCWDLSGWNPAHYEWRVKSGHYEERRVDRDCFEDRIVRPEQFATRIVVPERTESRLVERGFCRTVTVRPERVDVTYERVFVPGHWENR